MGGGMMKIGNYVHCNEGNAKLGREGEVSRLPLVAPRKLFGPLLR